MIIELEIIFFECALFDESNKSFVVSGKLKFECQGFAYAK